MAFDDLFETVNMPDDNYQLGWLSATHFTAKPAEKVRERAVVPASRSAPATEQRSIVSPSDATGHMIIPEVLLLVADSVELIPDSQANPPVELLVDDPTLGIGICWSQRHKPSLRLQESVQ